MDLAKKTAQKTPKPKKRAGLSKTVRGAGAVRAKLKKATRVIAQAKRTPRPRPATNRSSKPPVVSKPGRRRPAAMATEPTQVAVEPDQRAETFLTPEEVELFRQMLLQKRGEILGDVSTLHDEALNKDRRDAAGDLSSMPIHMADLGTDNYELEFTLGLIEGERAILREIDEALERIRRGTYGVCLATGKPIGKARLKAKPWAKFCYEYTLAQEQGQARRF
jgi:RNA polymerase-binding protein DksA